MKFVFLFLFYLFFYCRNSHPVLKEQTREPFANVRIYQFERIEYKGFGQKKWKLNAKEAYLYQDEKEAKDQKIVLYEFEFLQFLPHPAEARSERAVLDYTKNYLLIEGNAFYRDHEIQIEGSFLEYHFEKEHLESNQEVKIKRKNLETICQGGMLYDKKQELQICRKPRGFYLQ
ncbi:MAG: LPS export ABC transporter periplasmic protein LptC [Leptospiraceae bacterium]|nr:LPS export ABC transporter periplasmic protein LptC [Leptospiraceae bacterium]MDW7976403.1 LPS export ABC transporter periplasmic protein LptC [Leptospiraceae bacterium]